MIRFHDAAAIGLILGAATGFCLAATRIVAERYLDQELYGLALEVALSALWLSGAVALVSSTTIWLAGLAWRRILSASPKAQQEAGATRLQRTLTRAAGLSVLLVIGTLVLLRVCHEFALRQPLGEVKRPNVLVIVLDTVRRDRLSVYGYDKPTTPEIDRFASEAILFSNFHSTAPWTIPSHASLFTGLYPGQHGATQENSMLDPGVATLAEVLRNAGYQTWAASGNPYMGPYANLAQGFEHFEETWRSDPGPRGARAPHPANQAFDAFLERVDRGRPFFAFINYMDAHDPHITPGPFARRFLDSPSDVARARALGKRGWDSHYKEAAYTDEELALLSNLYDASLAYLSVQVGALLESARHAGLFDDTLIVLTSDHGEHFGENELVGHFFGLYGVAVQAPLILRPPGETKARVDRRSAQILDLFPTILAAARVEAEAIPHRGVDLLAPHRRAEQRSILSEYYYPVQVFELFSGEEQQRFADRLAPYRRRLGAIERDGFRFIWSSEGNHELYQLSSDPNERNNLYGAADRSAMAAEMELRLEGELRASLPELVSGSGRRAPSQVRELDSATREALRAIGYTR